MAYPPITTLPAAPSRNDPDNFSTEADAFVAALPTFVTDTNAAGVYTEGQATAAAQSAVDAAAEVVLAADEVALATTQAGNAATSANEAEAAAAAAVVTANADLWVSEASYAEGANAISLVDFGTYRSITTHTGVATDPSADATNWVKISAADPADYATAAQGTLADNAMPIAGGTFTGLAKAPAYEDAVVVLTGTTPAVDLSAAGEYRLTTTGDTTFTVSNPPPDDFTTTKTLRITQGATAYTLTFWAGIEAIGGAIPAAPALSETKEYTLRASTVSGTTIYVLTETGVVS
jgi:hypothetical protein